MKKCIWIFLACLCNDLPLFSQALQGRVTDAQTGEPIWGVSVYIDGSSTGTMTGEDGHFELTPRYKTLGTLVFSHVAYKSKKVDNPYTAAFLEIGLEPDVQELAEVVLPGDPFGRKQKLRVFREEFLGDDRAARQCRIVNEEVLSLFFNSEHKLLTATARAPLLIRNDYLGYTIRFDLEHFEVAFRSLSLARTDNIQYTRYLGTSHFEDIGQGKQPYSKRRIRAYVGSPMHLMRALYAGTTFDDRFSFWTLSGKQAASRVFERTGPDANRYVTLRSREKDLSVYHEDDAFYRTRLSFPGDPEITIDAYGNYTPYENLIWGGHMAGMRISRLLPSDYQIDHYQWKQGILENNSTPPVAATRSQHPGEARNRVSLPH